MTWKFFLWQEIFSFDKKFFDITKKSSFCKKFHTVSRNFFLCDNTFAPENLLFLQESICLTGTFWFILQKTFSCQICDKNAWISANISCEPEDFVGAWLSGSLAPGEYPTLLIWHLDNVIGPIPLSISSSCSKHSYSTYECSLAGFPLLYAGDTTQLYHTVLHRMVW